jgi:DNA-binding protein HU-beta
MHKQELIRHLAKKHRRAQTHYQEAINEIFTGVKEQLAQGKRITLIGFGTFYTRLRKPSTAIHFKTRQKVEVPAIRLAQFRPGDVLKRAVRGRPAPAKKPKKPTKKK